MEAAHLREDFEGSAHGALAHLTRPQAGGRRRDDEVAQVLRTPRWRWDLTWVLPVLRLGQLVVAGPGELAEVARGPVVEDYLMPRWPPEYPY